MESRILPLGFQTQLVTGRAQSRSESDSNREAKIYIVVVVDPGPVSAKVGPGTVTNGTGSNNSPFDHQK